MKLILRQGSYENATVISDRATEDVVRAAFDFLNMDSSLELVANDGSEIQTSLSPENSRYFVNLTEVSRRGEKVNSFIEGQLEGLDEVIKAFVYFYSNDPRLGNEFVWSEAPERSTSSDWEEELRQARDASELALSQLSKEDADEIREYSKRFSLMTDEERRIEVEESERRSQMIKAQSELNDAETDKIMRENAEAMAIEMRKLVSMVSAEEQNYQDVVELRGRNSKGYQPTALSVLSHGVIKDKMLCPHCQERGCVHVKEVKRKMGVSGGKATAALLTAGLSLWVAGLSRKEKISEAYCGNCETTWHF
jgi:hypothetical protein